MNTPIEASFVRSPKTREQIDGDAGLTDFLDVRMVSALMSGDILPLMEQVFNHEPESTMVMDLFIYCDASELNHLIDQGKIDSDWYTRYDNFCEEMRCEMASAIEEMQLQ